MILYSRLQHITQFNMQKSTQYNLRLFHIESQLYKLLFVDHEKLKCCVAA